MDRRNDNHDPTRAAVRNLERIVRELQDEKSELQRRLEQSERRVQELEQRSNDHHSAQELVDRMARQHAEHITQIETERRSEKVKFRAVMEGKAALEGASTALPLNWHVVQRMHEHPFHVLRNVLLSDQRREEAMRNGAFEVHASEVDLEDLLVRQEPDRPHSADEETWRAVNRRVYQVLSERRKMAHLLNVETPTDFLLRSRHMMVSEWVTLHQSLLQLETEILFLASTIATPVLRSASQVQSTPVVGVGNREKPPQGHPSHAASLEKIGALIGEMELVCVRVEGVCFSEVDRLVHDVKTVAL